MVALWREVQLTPMSSKSIRMARIRLVIVEDNRLLREGLTALLKEQSDIVVVASLGSGDALIRGKRLKPDVILLDLGLRSHNSLRVVESVRALDPAARIVIMDLAPVQTTLVEYVRAGVSGFVVKDATFDEFLQTIRAVAQGAKVLPPKLTASLFSQLVERVAVRSKGDPFRSVRMTRREHEVVDLIAEGLSNKEIAQRLHLAIDTVKSHVHNILEKLTLHTRLEIASYRHADQGSSSSRPADSSADE
jgi:DNA-binding NarL/FixJ family response regulator